MRSVRSLGGDNQQNTDLRTDLVGAKSGVFRQPGNLNTFLIFTQLEEATARVQQVTNHLIVYLHHHANTIETHEMAPQDNN